MATISKAETRVTGYAQTVLWETMGNADSGEALNLANYPPADIIAQATGTFGSATVAIEGSVDGTNYVDLDDLDGTAIALTAAGIAAVRSAPLYIRPATSGGSGTDVDVTLLVRFLR